MKKVRRKNGDSYIAHHGYALHYLEVVQTAGTKVYAQVESKLL